MGLYSEMIEEEKIFERLEDSKNILLITCPGCTCESLSYSEEIPCRKIEERDMEKNALATLEVRNKWINKLSNQGKNVKTINVIFPCEMFDDERDKITNNLNNVDTVLILACSSAYVGIKDLIKNKDIKIVPMMKTKGSFVMRLVKDESGANSRIDKENSRIFKNKI